MEDDFAEKNDDHIIIESLLDEIRASEDPPVRHAAMRRLAKMGAPVLPYLQEWLYDEPSMRFDAALTLAWMGDAALGVLIEAMQGDDADVSAAAASVLSETVGLSERLHPIALEALAHSDARVRLGAVRWCTHNGLRDAVPSLLILLHDDDVTVKKAVVEAVGEVFHVSEAVPQLIALLGDPEVEVQREAAKSLMFLRDARAVSPLIRAFSNSEDRIFRSKIISALGTSQSTQAFKFLLDILPKEPDVQVHVMRALSWFRDSEAVHQLLPFVEHTDSYVRQVALMALAEIGDPGSLDSALTQLADEDPHIRLQAVKVLGAIGNERAVTALIKTLEDDEPSVVQAAIFKLVAIGNWRAVEPFRALADSEDAEIRRMIPWALEKLDNDHSGKQALETTE